MWFCFYPQVGFHTSPHAPHTTAHTPYRVSTDIILVHFVTIFILIVVVKPACFSLADIIECHARTSTPPHYSHTHHSLQTASGQCFVPVHISSPIFVNGVYIFHSFIFSYFFHVSHTPFGAFTYVQKLTHAFIFVDGQVHLPKK